MKKIININDYRFRLLDERNWVIEKKHIIEKGDNAGNIRWSVEGYYGRFEHMIEALLQYKLNDKSSEEIENIQQSIEHLAQQFEEIKAEILEALKTQ